MQPPKNQRGERIDIRCGDASEGAQPIPGQAVATTRSDEKQVLFGALSEGGPVLKPCGDPLTESLPARRAMEGGPGVVPKPASRIQEIFQEFDPHENYSKVSIMTSHDQNPSFRTHVKMFAICLTTAVFLAVSIALGFGQAFELVKWIGSR